MPQNAFILLESLGLSCKMTIPAFFSMLRFPFCFFLHRVFFCVGTQGFFPWNQSPNLSFPVTLPTLRWFLPFIVAHTKAFLYAHRGDRFLTRGIRLDWRWEWTDKKWSVLHDARIWRSCWARGALIGVTWFWFVVPCSFATFSPKVPGGLQACPWVTLLRCIGFRVLWTLWTWPIRWWACWGLSVFPVRFSWVAL